MYAATPQTCSRQGPGYVRGSEHSSRCAPTRRAEPSPRLVGRLPLAPPGVRAAHNTRPDPGRRALQQCASGLNLGGTHPRGTPQRCRRSRTSKPCSQGSGRPRPALASTPTRCTSNPARCLSPAAQARGDAAARGQKPRPASPGVRWAPFEVCGRLADGQRAVYAFGGRPQPPARPQGVGGDGYPPSEKPMLRSVKAPRAGSPPRRKASWRTQWGQLDGRGPA